MTLLAQRRSSLLTALAMREVTRLAQKPRVVSALGEWLDPWAP